MIEMLEWDPEKAIEAFDLSRGHKQVLITRPRILNLGLTRSGEEQLSASPEIQRMGNKKEKVFLLILY